MKKPVMENINFCAVSTKNNVYVITMLILLLLIKFDNDDDNNNNNNNNNAASLNNTVCEVHVSDRGLRENSDLCH